MLDFKPKSKTITTPISILFVCYENICRSPMAEGIFSALIAQHGLQHYFSISSAGTVPYQRDSSPDNRATEVLLRHNIDISALRAQCIDDVDLHACEWIFVMDYENYEEVDRYFATHNRPRLHLMMDFVAERSGEEIPDPYYDGFDAFEQVKEHLLLASEHILAMLMAHYPHLQEAAMQ